ncbi:MAG: PfkB family carbohydrate kinase [Oscillospiraceae bacterium]
MTRTEYDVVALGELLIDFTAQGAGADGYPLMAAHPGGAPANFLAAIARLGGRTALLSKVGADAFGTMLTGTLREVGVDTRGVVVAEDAFTTLAFVTLAARGERSFPLPASRARTRSSASRNWTSRSSKNKSVPLRNAFSDRRACARRDAARRRLCKGTREAHHLRPQSAPTALEKP